MFEDPIGTNDWKKEAMTALVKDLRAGDPLVEVDIYNGGLEWYDHDKLLAMSGATLTSLSDGKLLNIEGVDGIMLVYVETFSGFELLHKGSLLAVLDAFKHIDTRTRRSK